MKRRLDLFPTVMSNSGTTASVSEYFCLCHSQPVRWTNQPGMAKEQSQPHLIPGCQQKKASPGPSPSPQIANPPPWSDIPREWGVPLCKGLSLRQQHKSKTWGSSSPGCSIHLSKQPVQDSHRIQMEQTRGSTGKQTPDGMEEQGEGEEEEKSSVVCTDSTNPLWGNGKGRGGREKQGKRWGIFPLVPEPCRDPAPKAALPSLHTPAGLF